MFYLETRDGEKFFTDKDSDDKVEFWKILDKKLGRSAAELFDDILKAESYSADDIQETLDKVLCSVETVNKDLDEIVSVLENLVKNSETIEKSDIEIYTNELKRALKLLEKLK